MRSIYIVFAIFAMVFFGYHQVRSMDTMEKTIKDTHEKMASAVFAGGCFWCTESDFEKVDGVIEAISGYTGGHIKNPTYRQVSGGGTGHVEVVKVTYDPKTVSYEKLLEVFWQHVDPTDPGGQFVDRGAQYRSAIFYANGTEKHLAEESKQRLAASGRFNTPIVTDILPLGEFYPAENYHQDYYKKNPIRYHWYRSGSGRDKFLKKAWADQKTDMKKNATKTGMDGGMKKTDMSSDTRSNMDSSDMATEMKKDMLSDANKDDMSMAMMKENTGGDMRDSKMKPQMNTETTDASGAMMTDTPEGMSQDKRMYRRPDDKELRARLSPMQYKVTQQDGTEPPFKNAYWNNHEAGIYVDIVTGEPLFGSTDKFESGTGWPSFTRPLEPKNIVEKTDRSLWMIRTEVRSRHGDSHLGHVFNDGPKPTGLRYCINSAALRFIPAKDLQKEGYGKYRNLFE